MKMPSANAAGLGQLLLKNRASGGVRARLKDGPQPTVRDNVAAGRSGFRESRSDDDRNRRSQSRRAPRRALPVGARCLRTSSGRFGSLPRRRRRSGPPTAAMAALRTLNSPISGDSKTASPKVKREPFARITHIADPLRAIFRKADLDNGRQGIARDFHAVWIVAVEQDHSVLRHDVDQLGGSSI